MNKNKITIIVQAAFIAFLILFAFFVGYYLGTNSAIVRAGNGFDHSQCQYPNRLSNPENGCDNTDPARPECMKFGTEDCDIPLPISNPEPEDISSTPEQTPIVTKICN